MIRSMTGYGSAKGKAGGLSLCLELRSVNNRYLDLSIRVPRGFLFAEEEMKSYLQERIARGKLDVFLNITGSEEEQLRVHINDQLAASYLDAMKQLAEEHQLPVNLSSLDLARLPEVMTLEKEELDQQGFLEELRVLMDQAVLDYNTMREREGGKLCEDLRKKAQNIENLVEQIEIQAPKTLAAYKERLESKMRDVLSDSGVAQERILAEAAIYADRIATDEELVRLRSHLSQFDKMLQEGSPIGRKMDFLIQEFNREANTIASKCQDSSVAYLVVDMKAEIEKIREQVQNIE